MSETMGQFVDKLLRTNPQVLILLAGSIAGAGGATLIALRVQRRWVRLTCACSAIALLGRAAVFPNPAALLLLHRLLPAEQVGFRQADALRKDYEHTRTWSPVRYLAVGSSQASAVFSEYCNTHEDAEKFAMAGLGPCGQYVYLPYMLERKPQVIVVYLSAFDMGRKPPLAAAKLGPFLGYGRFRSILPILAETNTWTEIGEFAVANVLPEYRYQYVWRGLLDRVSGRNQAFPERNVLTRMRSTDHLLEQGRRLAELTHDALPANLALVRMLADQCTKRSVKLVIVEGHFHPDFYTKKQALNRAVREGLSELARQRSDVYFVPREETTTFVPEDYADPYHVHKEAGRRFSEALFGACLPRILGAPSAFP